MRRRRSQSFDDFDTVDVLLVEEEEDVDEFLDVLHQIALEAMALRATSPGDPRTESAALGPAWADAGDHAAGRLARRLWAGHRLRLVTIAAVLLSVAVAPGLLGTRQAAARLAAMVATPAVLGPATSPPVEVWRTTGRVVSDRPDVLLVADASAGSLRRLDPATGEALWTASAAVGGVAAAGRCFAVDEGLGPGGTPDEGDAGPEGLVACVAATRVVPGSGGETDQVRVVVVDTTTGETRHTVTADGTLVTVEPVGRDLLVAVALADGRLGAARWDLATRQAEWEHVSAPSVLAADGATGYAVERRPDSLTVGPVSLDLRTGEELDAEQERRTPLRYEEHVLPGGARATWSWRPDGDSGRGQVTRDVRGRVFSLPGPPLPPAITDGSEARTLVAMTADGERLRGLDLRTGRMRWTQPYAGAVPVHATAQVDGVMLLDGGATVTAVDVRDGRQLWGATVASGVTQGSALTDGEVVLLPARFDGALWLVAWRIADGTEVWRGGTPLGTVALTVADHHLVATTGDAVVGLVSPPQP